MDSWDHPVFPAPLHPCVGKELPSLGMASVAPGSPGWGGSWLAPQTPSLAWGADQKH